MPTHDLRIARMQQTLRRFEEDIPLLNLRVKELSRERQKSAKQFAAAVIQQTRAELEKLLQNEDRAREDFYTEDDPPCEPAD